MFHREVISENNVFSAYPAEIYNGKSVLAKVRYSAPPTEAVIRVHGKQVITEFKEAQRAATPGQSIVFYEDDRVIGGGFIEK